MSFFKGIDGAKAPINSEYMRAGRYLCYVRAIKGITSRKGVKHVLFETTVVHVLDSAASAAEAKGPHRIGESATWDLDMSKDPSLPALKAALMVLCNQPEEAITEQFCDQILANNLLQGAFVEMDNRVIKTQKTGAPFTLCKARRRWGAEEVKKTVSADLMASLKIDTSLA